jgi:hypothetical protein
MVPAGNHQGSMQVRSTILLVGSFCAVVAIGILVIWILGGAPLAPVDEVGDGLADAQERDCRFFTVAADDLNVFKEPRAASNFVVRLAKGDVVCAARGQPVGDLVWIYVMFRLEEQNKKTPVNGWTVKRRLRPSESAELAARRRALASAEPPAIGPPRSVASDVVKFSEPITSGAYPVIGRSLAELIAGVPLFPPIEGLEESAWKKTCNNCHKWDKQTLCVQAGVYVKNPKAALRIKHPYGGPEKVAMMKWAEGGCQ